MKRLFILIFMAIALTSYTQVVEFDVVVDTVPKTITIQLDLTSVLSNYVTHTELNGSILPLYNDVADLKDSDSVTNLHINNLYSTTIGLQQQIDSINTGVVPDNVLTTQHFADFFDFTYKDSVWYKKDKNDILYVSPDMDTVDMKIVRLADSNYFFPYYGDWKNFGAWIHNYVAPVFPEEDTVGYYGWGRWAYPDDDCKKDTVLVIPQ